MSKKESQSIFMSSITDLMTSLAVVFILLLVVYVNHAQVEAKKLKNVISSLEMHSKGAMTMKEKLRKRLLAAKLPFEDDPDDALALAYTARDNQLEFDKNSAVLKDEGEEYLDDFIPRLVAVLGQDDIRPQVESVLIVGYTDSTGGDEHNLKLSQSRAFSVLQYSLNHCGLRWREHELFLDLTSISGRGERELLPKGSDPGDEDAGISRRVQFKIRVKSIEQNMKDGKSLLEAMESAAQGSSTEGSSSEEASGGGSSDEGTSDDESSANESSSEDSSSDMGGAGGAEAR